MKCKILPLVIVAVILVSVFQIAAYAQTNPTITSPASDGASFSRGDRKVIWSSVSNATYTLSMRDLTVNMLALSNVSMDTSTSYTIPMKYFYEGHSYRVAIGATVGTTTTWSARTFNISLSSARSTIIQRGSSMNTYKWTPSKNVRGWKNGKTFCANTTYTGIPYSQTEYQCSISAVPWSYGSYFDTKKSDNTSGFYDNYTSNETIMPKYGNDCSGYVSVCWNVNRHRTGDISTHTQIGKSGETELKKYARMSPGDALVIAGDHTFLIKSITAVNDANGNLVKLMLGCNEQTPYNCGESTKYSDSCISTGYKGVLKDSSLTQDYTWNWQ